MSKRSPLIVEVLSDGKVIGRLDPSEFMKQMGRHNRFLADLIADFNQMKKAAGEPERVRTNLGRT